MARNFVYLIRDDVTGFIKIGISESPLKRLAQLKREPTLLPAPLEFRLLDAWKGDTQDEAYLHGRFAAFRRRGEWFELETGQYADIVEYFESKWGEYAGHFVNFISDDQAREHFPAEMKKRDRRHREHQSYDFAEAAGWVDHLQEEGVFI